MNSLIRDQCANATSRAVPLRVIRFAYPSLGEERHPQMWIRIEFTFLGRKFGLEFQKKSTKSSCDTENDLRLVPAEIIFPIPSRSSTPCRERPFRLATHCLHDSQESIRTSPDLVSTLCTRKRTQHCQNISMMWVSELAMSSLGTRSITPNTERRPFPTEAYNWFDESPIPKS